LILLEFYFNIFVCRITRENIFCKKKFYKFISINDDVLYVTFKNQIFREMTLPLFILLQIIQLSFETFFNEKLRFWEISIAVILNCTPCVCINFNINRRITMTKIMVGAGIECKKRDVNASFTFYCFNLFLLNVFGLRFHHSSFAFDVPIFIFARDCERIEIFDLTWFKEWISSSKSTFNLHVNIDNKLY